MSFGLFLKRDGGLALTRKLQKEYARDYQHQCEYRGCQRQFMGRRGQKYCKNRCRTLESRRRLAVLRRKEHRLS